MQRGFHGMAVESVAKMAGVGKTTIYRWWADRASLAVEAFFDGTVQELSFPDTGSTALDFRAQLRQLAGVLRGERGQVLAALIIGSHTDVVLARALEEKWFRRRREWGLERMMLAVQREECVPGVAVQNALDALYSPLYARLFLRREVHTDEEIERHCNFLFPLIFSDNRPT